MVAPSRNHRYQLASATSVALDRTASKRSAMIPHSGTASPSVAGICDSMSRSCLLRSKEPVVVSCRQRIVLPRRRGGRQNYAAISENAHSRAYILLTHSGRTGRV